MKHRYFGELSDQDLVHKHLAGDRGAFTEIFHRYATRLMWVARRYTRNEQDAHDILQEAFFNAARNLHTFRAEASLSTWLHRLVMNSGYDFAHHRSRREVATLDNEVIPHEFNLRLSYDPVSRVDLVLLLRQALATLRPEQSAALLLVDLVGYNVTHVADLHGVAPGTIKSRRCRARENLREALEPSLG
ncbi:ECF RNA polymerase sigma factor SigM [Corynebacterium occultum]|uniref:ECF RNA polymerase sigma factor SigM n=1 Tax=Corynebacterium occultum TaxID=2675219 RepID=A0A6B8W7S3_9CORY|nr:sigma-70 family RNA polymerase sigma factor [Corynebacterium occultum]QGU08701.1 ECF RNA polymerase sigma factor SigM [Corynebacterium occultum]